MSHTSTILPFTWLIRPVRETVAARVGVTQHVPQVVVVQGRDPALDDRVQPAAVRGERVELRERHIVKAFGRRQRADRVKRRMLRGKLRKALQPDRVGDRSEARRVGNELVNGGEYG